jgi:hypothetical protein
VPYARNELEKRLLTLDDGDELVSLLTDAIYDAEESGEGKGYNLGVKDSYKEGEMSQKSTDKLQTRYEYLKHGGRWQVDQEIGDYEHAEDYLRGFLDAMRTIGVKP